MTRLNSQSAAVGVFYIKAQSKLLERLSQEAKRYRFLSEPGCGENQQMFIAPLALAGELQRIESGHKRPRGRVASAL